MAAHRGGSDIAQIMVSRLRTWWTSVVDVITQAFRSSFGSAGLRLRIARANGEPLVHFARPMAGVQSLPAAAVKAVVAVWPANAGPGDVLRQARILALRRDISLRLRC